MSDDAIQTELRAALGQTLATETRANERIIADIRVAVCGATAVVQWVGALVVFPSVGMRSLLPIYMPLGMSAALALAIGLAILVRRSRHYLAIGLIAPVIDACLLAFEHISAWEPVRLSGIEMMGVASSYGVTCSLLAASGSLRLSIARSWWTSALALTAFTAGTLTVSWGLDLRSFAFALMLLFMVCLLSARMTGVTRRALQGEVAKGILARFLPPSVVASAHLDPLALLTEPRSVDATVLASDLRGFTTFAETLPPGEVLAFLSEVHGACARVVHEHRGTVDKFIGDGMLAVFGTPVPLEGHAAHAVAAAQGIRAALKAINIAREARGATPLKMGIGIHSGAVVTGCLGGAERLEFTVLGDTVNTATRLEGLTKEKACDVLVSEETVRRAGSPASLVPLGEVTLRGRAAPLKVFSLTGLE